MDREELKRIADEFDKKLQDLASKILKCHDLENRFTGFEIISGAVVFSGKYKVLQINYGFPDICLN